MCEVSMMLPMLLPCTFNEISLVAAGFEDRQY